MGRPIHTPAPPSIDRSSPRSLFSELVACALEDLDTRVSPMARSYVVELLDGQLSAPRNPLSDYDDSVAALSEAFDSAREQGGLDGVPRIRSLGDRALFVSGFFRGTTAARQWAPHDYATLGRAAYRNISEMLAARIAGSSWTNLFRELAERFDEFERILAEVGDAARPDAGTDLLRVYDRYVRTGSLRDRAVLQSRGLTLPPRSAQREC